MRKKRKKPLLLVIAANQDFNCGSL